MSEPLKVSDPSQVVKIVLGVVFGIVIVVLLVVVSKKQGSVLGGNGPIEPSLSLGLNTSSTVTNIATTTPILAARTQTRKRTCYNNGPFRIIIGATSTGLADGNGFLLAASGTITWDGDGLYTGDIFGRGPAGTSTFSCAEW